MHLFPQFDKIGNDSPQSRCQQLCLLCDEGIQYILYPHESIEKLHLPGDETHRNVFEELT